MICEGEPGDATPVVIHAAPERVPVTDEDVARGCLEPGWLLVFAYRVDAAAGGEHRLLACGHLPGPVFVRRSVDGEWCASTKGPGCYGLLCKMALDVEATDVMELYERPAPELGQLTVNGDLLQRSYNGNFQHIAVLGADVSVATGVERRARYWLYRRRPCGLK